MAYDFSLCFTPVALQTVLSLVVSIPVTYYFLWQADLVLVVAGAYIGFILGFCV